MDPCRPAPDVGRRRDRRPSRAWSASCSPTPSPASSRRRTCTRSRRLPLVQEGAATFFLGAQPSERARTAAALTLAADEHQARRTGLCWRLLRQGEAGVRAKSSALSEVVRGSSEHGGAPPL